MAAHSSQGLFSTSLTAGWWPRALPRLSLFQILVLLLSAITAVALLEWAVGFSQLARIFLPQKASTEWAKPPPAHIILSMGTMGGRADYLLESLPALLNQTVKAEHLIISFNKAEPFQIQKLLEVYGPFEPGYGGKEVPGLSKNGTAEGRLVVTGKHGLVLQFLDKSWGPGTKLVGAYLIVGSRPDTVIITVDDDCRYPLDHVEEFMKHLPADRGAVGGYCEEPLNVRKGTWLRTDSIDYHQYLYKGQVAECRGWLMGFGGAVYWASSFDDSLLNFLSTLPHGCFYHDDVWLSGYLHQRGIKRYLFYGIARQSHAGHHPNLSIHHASGNDPNLQIACVQHFKRFKSIPGHS